jgi:hypothetical protein
MEFTIITNRMDNDRGSGENRKTTEGESANSTKRKGKQEGVPEVPDMKRSRKKERRRCW